MYVILEGPGDFYLCPGIWNHTAGFPNSCPGGGGQFSTLFADFSAPTHLLNLVINWLIDCGWTGKSANCFGFFPSKTGMEEPCYRSIHYFSHHFLKHEFTDRVACCFVFVYLDKLRLMLSLSPSAPRPFRCPCTQSRSISCTFTMMDGPKQRQITCSTSARASICVLS